jgi:dipeptidyl-peptidase 4
MLIAPISRRRVHPALVAPSAALTQRRSYDGVMSTALSIVFAAIMLALFANTGRASDHDLLTVAETSDFTATATSDEVLDLIRRIDARSAITHVTELGRTFEDRPIPLVIVANPPVRTAEEARASGKVVVFIFANIHAGEVEGKEASLMLLRKVALDPDHRWLANLILVFAPNYNADGNDRMGTDTRPNQVGPEQGQGTRANAMGLDLNRDYVKLESPEAQAMVRFLTEWDPDVTFDCHATNGSRHRYTLTYEAPLNPSGHSAPMAFLRDELLPHVTERVKEEAGYDTWFYGNFNREHTVWSTYSALPRFGGPYQGLRNQMSVLLEAYSYAPYKDRIIVTREFLRHSLDYVAANRERIVEINRQAREDVARMGENPQPHDVVGIRHRIAAFNQPVRVKGYALPEGFRRRGVVQPDSAEWEPVDHLCVHLGRFEPTLSVRRPAGYLIPPGYENVIEKLKQHGIEVEPFVGRALVEAYTITSVTRAPRPFEGHRLTLLDAEASLVEQDYPDGSWFASTAQPLGTLLVYLLEPQSEDGFVAWNIVADEFEVGEAFPIARVPSRNDF